MATIEDRQAARDARLDELHEKLAGAVEELASGDDWKRTLTFAANFRSRSFNNTLLIWVQHQAAHEQGLVPDPMPTYVAGYKQWQDLGRQVQKGQPGYQILAPVTGRFASATPANADLWRRLKKFEKPRPGETVRSKMIGVRPAYVWDASQTAGDPLPELPAPTLLEGEAPAGLWEGLAKQVEAAGFSLGDVPDTPSIRGANGVSLPRPPSAWKVRACHPRATSGGYSCSSLFSSVSRLGARKTPLICGNSRIRGVNRYLPGASGEKS